EATPTPAGDVSEGSVGESVGGSVAGGARPRIFDAGTGEDITEFHNLTCRSGATLRHACTSPGLPASGTKRQLARRLVGAGLTVDEVEARFGWRARKSSSV